MSNLIEEFIYIQEVNRVVQGLSKITSKPQDHIGKIWADTEKEILLKHKYGVTDKYKAIGKIVKAKLGVKDEEPEPAKADDEVEDKKDKNE